MARESRWGRGTTLPGEASDEFGIDSITIVRRRGVFSKNSRS